MFYQECPSCLGTGCEACHGRGLLAGSTLPCPQCREGRIGRFVCPLCQGEGELQELGPLEVAPRVIPAARLAAAIQRALRDDLYEEQGDDYALGLVSGLYRIAAERYPEDAEARTRWLVAVCERGQLVVDLDGIWQVHGQQAVCLTSFAEVLA